MVLQTQSERCYNEATIFTKMIIIEVVNLTNWNVILKVCLKQCNVVHSKTTAYLNNLQLHLCQSTEQ